MVNRWWRIVGLLALLSSQAAGLASGEDIVFSRPFGQFGADLAPPAAPLRETGNGPMPPAGPTQGAPPNWQAPVAAPPTQWIVPSPGQPAMPANQPPVQDPRGMPNPGFLGGEVFGQLLNGGRPVVNCHVVIVPMHEVNGANRFDEDRKALASVTDENGVFHFEGVPAGGYKLTWLPEGQNQWIRRISMKPDVHVRQGETTKLKEIRVALQTIN
jgi:hypothetical protein